MFVKPETRLNPCPVNTKFPYSLSPDFLFSPSPDFVYTRETSTSLLQPQGPVWNRTHLSLRLLRLNYLHHRCPCPSWVCHRCRHTWESQSALIDIKYFRVNSINTNSSPHPLTRARSSQGSRHPRWGWGRSRAWACRRWGWSRGGRGCTWWWPARWWRPGTQPPPPRGSTHPATQVMEPLNKLEDTACYACLLLAPTEGFGFLCFLCCFGSFLAILNVH